VPLKRVRIRFLESELLEGNASPRFDLQIDTAVRQIHHFFVIIVIEKWSIKELQWIEDDATKSNVPNQHRYRDTCERSNASTKSIWCNGTCYSMLQNDSVLSMAVWLRWEEAAIARGIAGESEGRGYVVHEVKIGDIVFRQLPTRSQLEGQEPAGGYAVLGTWALRQYRVTFDFRRGKLWLEQ